MLLVFQIIFVLFTFFAISSVIKKKKQGLLGPKGTIFWIIFWIAVAIAVAWPESTAKIAKIFEIGRGVDFVFYIAIATLFYLIFKLHIKVETIARDVTKVVRDKAIKETLNNK